MTAKTALKLTASALALAAFGFAAPALAVTSSGGSVAVNINVLPTVSMWSNDANINLVLDGTGQENRKVVASSLSVINNVDANITAAVTGTLPPKIFDNALPPHGPNLVSQVNFFIFKSGTEADATAAIIGNSNLPGYATPNAALVWTVDNLGASQQVIASTGVNPSIVSLPIVYGADAPNVLPAVANFSLTVTYTITSNL
jgi:hypothetical protein